MATELGGFTLDINTGNPFVDVLGTALGVAAAYKVTEKLTGGNKEAAAIVAGATGAALTSAWNPTETVAGWFTTPEAAMKDTAPDAPKAPGAAMPLMAPVMPTDAQLKENPSMMAGYYGQLTQYQNQMAQDRYDQSELRRTREAAAAQKQAMYGSVIGAIGQGLIADRTAEKQAESEKALLEEKYRLEAEADSGKYNPADFSAFSEYLNKTGRPQQIGNTGLTQVGGAVTANADVAAQQQKYQNAMANMQQQRGAVR